MENHGLARHQEAEARQIMEESPVLVISGARQVGKSTLMRQLLEGRGDCLIVNLDEARLRSAAQQDPDGFADQYPEGVLAIDEVQRVPELFTAVKAALERNRRPGRFILTGSSNLETLKGRVESLAGRAQTLNLRGLSQGELEGVKEDFAEFAFSITTDTNGLRTADPADTLQRSDYFTRAVRTCFPEPRLNEKMRQGNWLRKHVNRVLSRDAQNLVLVQYPDRLLPILRRFAANPAAELVAASVARDLDIPQRSVPSYVAALSDVFFLDEIPAWSHNLLKRAVNKPKVMFRDVAVASYLAGMDAEALEADISSSLTGGLIENFVVSELAKQQDWSEIEFELFHYRDRDGNEVDAILEDRARNIVGLEVKCTTSVSAKHFKGLRFLQAKAGKNFRAGIVLYLGDQCLRFGPGLWALPVETLWRHPVGR